MRDRVKKLGGRVRVVTAPGKGTRLRVVIPL
jgi:signal transduction histidine kinase